MTTRHANMTTRDLPTRFFLDASLTESTVNHNGTTNNTFEDNVWIFGLETLGIFHAIRLLQAVVGLIGNSMTIMAVLRIPVLQTPSNVLVVSLAVADLTGVPYAIFAVVTDFIGNRSSYWMYVCLTQESLGLISRMGNVYFICGLVVERYLAIMHPLSYLSNVTVSKVSIACAITWVFIVTYSILLIWLGNNLHIHAECRFAHFLPYQMYAMAIIVHYTFITCVTIVLHIRLWFTAWKQVKRIRSVEMMFGRPPAPYRHGRMTRTVGIILGTYLALTCPPIIISVITKACKKAYAGWLPPWLRVVDLFKQNVWFANSFINPFIYAFRHETFRTAFKRLTCRGRTY